MRYGLIAIFVGTDVYQITATEKAMAIGANGIGRCRGIDSTGRIWIIEHYIGIDGFIHCRTKGGKKLNRRPDNDGEIVYDLLDSINTVIRPIKE